MRKPSNDISDVSENDSDSEFQMPPENYGAKGRQSISSEVYGIHNKLEDQKTPIYPKTPEQMERIDKALKQSFLFQRLNASARKVIVEAFQEYKAPKETKVVVQGDDGDCLYLVEGGKCSAYKREGNQSPKKVAEISQGDVFGELALMYNSPRMATVVVDEDLVAWSLDRVTYNVVLRKANAERLEHFESMLSKVPLLKSIEPYERIKLVDAIREVEMKAGEVIVYEGELGNEFYMMAEGKAKATKSGLSLKDYGAGDYFGELALLRGQPRAATVTATDNCRLMVVNRRAFQRLLGPLEPILKRNMENYKKTLESLGLPTDEVTVS